MSRHRPLIFAQIFYVVIFTWTEVTGGENGLSFSRPVLGLAGIYTVPFTTTTLHWFILFVVALSYLLLRRITQSPFGMVSFGHSAFFGLGMYGAAAALLTTHPASLWVALLYGLIAAAAPYMPRPKNAECPNDTMPV